jgi:hypothetical protein
VGSDLQPVRVRHGGIVSLARTVVADTQAVEADLAQHYGVALTDLYRGKLTVRRLAVLVAQLPQESRVVMHATGMDAPWTLESEALATVADLTYALLRVTVAANSKRGRTGMPSFTFPRPYRQASSRPAARPVEPPAPQVVRGFAAFEHDWGNGRG